MRLETHRNRLEQRRRTAMQLTDTHERVKATKLAEKAKEDIFLRMCEINHMEAVEREAKCVRVPTAVVKPTRQAKAEQPVNLLRRKMEAFLSGMSVGAAVALLIVWLLLLAAGVI